MSTLQENLQIVKRNISDAALKSGRSPEDITLVCVTKQIPIEEILEALALGVKTIGESRVEEAIIKKENIPQDISLHMIGHLQSRKVKDAVKIFDLIHSVDSVDLAEEINKRANSINKIQDILIELNISGEETKYGVKPDDVIEIIKKVSVYKSVKVLGLMTMAPFYNDPEMTRPIFRKLKSISENIKKENISNVEIKYLSMGMTNDYIIAIEEGSNMVRIGTAIFKV